MLLMQPHIPVLYLELQDRHDYKLKFILSLLQVDLLGGYNRLIELILTMELDVSGYVKLLLFLGGSIQRSRLSCFLCENSSCLYDKKND